MLSQHIKPHHQYRQHRNEQGIPSIPRGENRGFLVGGHGAKVGVLFRMLCSEVHPLRFSNFEHQILSMKAALQLELSFDQILSLVKQLPQSKKLKLSKALETDGIESRLTSILQAFKTDDLSEDDITAEVEAVRQARYEKGKR
jgi:hypothetical protein